MAGVLDQAERKLIRMALARWSGPARSLINGTLFFHILAAAGWVGFAWGIGRGVEAIAVRQESQMFWAVALAGVATRVMSFWLSDSFASLAGNTMTEVARKEIFGALARSGAGILSGASPGERTAQIIDRTARLHAYAANWLPGVRVAAAAPIILLVAAATQSWVVALLLALALAILPLFIWLTASRTAEAARAQQSALETLSGAFQSASAHAGLIRAFRSIGREAAALRDASEELRARTMAILRMAFLTSAVLEFFSSISIALVAVYVGFKLLGVFPFSTGETVTLAEGLTALILAPEYFGPIRRLSGLHHDRSDGVAAAGVIAPWLDAATRSPSIYRLPKLAGPPRIVFSDVTLSYGDGETAIAGISFTVNAGEVVALAGPSGSGKSTCLLALIGRATLRNGRIEIGECVFRPGDSLADSVSFMRQSPWLLEGSLAENIALAKPEASRAQIEAAAKASGVSEFAVNHPKGIDRRLARFGAGLSGGQRQRLALARAIVRDAPLWLADEPTVHLDSESEAAFLTSLRQLTVGRTVLIATHSEAVIAACDRVVWMPALSLQGAAG